MHTIWRRPFHLLALTATLLFFWGGAPAVAQAPPETVVDSSMFRPLEFENIGPARGGRSIGVAGSDSRPLEYYFGATGGGLWKTTDGGTTWKPVTDGQINSASVGAVAVCNSNPDVVYIGTGETQIRGNIQPGDGLYKSTDAGKTWTHIGLREAHNFSRVRVHPTDCNTVYAGAFGHYGVPNPERGVYRSTDGGQNWEKVLFRSDSTGAVDISIDPNNPNTIYAALWQAWRKPWGMSSGGPESGFFKSTDGGDTWTELTRNPGLPQEPNIGKIGVAVSPVDANRVYAIIEADSGGVFRSDDAGATWTAVNDERKLRQRAFYYTRIYADPQERDLVYVLNTAFYKSTDAGDTFPDSLRSNVPHGDNHDLWIASNDNQRMINANDGGGNVSFNGGETWTEQDFPTAQIYRLYVTNDEPYHLCGGQQDNSTVCVPSAGWDHLQARGPNHGYYYAVGGCESGYVAQDPRDLDIFFAGCYGGSLSRYDHETGQTRLVNVWPENPMGQSAEDLRERIQWTFPIVYSPHDPSVLYTTSQYVYRSANEGQSWERISPDLTRALDETMGPSGGPITRDQTGVETYATIFAFAPSPHDAQTMWVGSDDGLAHVTRDGGANWQNVTPAELPELSKITTIDPSPHNPGTAYLSAHRFLMGDFSPYLFRTDDYGQTWTRIVDGMPEDEVTRSIREDVVRPGLLFAGTERGVWVSWDNGDNWQYLKQNLPVVQVADLAVTERDLALATHGRSFYVMRNIAPIRQWTPEIAQSRLHLFEPDIALRDLDPGVSVFYYLNGPADEITLEFLDPSGEVIRSFSAEPEAEEGEGEDEEESFFGRGQQKHAPTEAGLNKFVWDLRTEGYAEFPEMIFWAARNAGPMVLPGQYQVRLTVDGQTQTQPFEVGLDPRLEDVPLADLQRRYDLATQIRDRVTDANEAVVQIREVKAQVDSLLTQTDDPRITEGANQLMERLTAVEQEVYQIRNRSNQDPLNFPIKLNNKLAALLGMVEGAEAAPTEQSYAVFEELSGQLNQQLEALDLILDRQLAEFNTQLREARMTEIPLPERGEGGGGTPR